MPVWIIVILCLTIGDGTGDLYVHAAGDAVGEYYADSGVVYLKIIFFSPSHIQTKGL